VSGRGRWEEVTCNQLPGRRKGVVRKIVGSTYEGRRGLLSIHALVKTALHHPASRSQGFSRELGMKTRDSSL
jgi:hypothetical protein